MTGVAQEQAVASEPQRALGLEHRPGGVDEAWVGLSQSCVFLDFRSSANGKRLRGTNE